MHIRHYHGGFFANFNPGALRTANLVKALILGGHTVDVVTGDSEGSDLRHVAELFNLPACVRVVGGAAPSQSGLRGRMPRRIRPTAVEPGGLSLPEIVIVFDPNPMTFRDVSRYCRLKKIPLVLDIDEWMGPSDFSLTSWLTLFPLRYEAFMSRLPRMVSNAFAISKAMEAHMASSGADTLLVPPLHDHDLSLAAVSNDTSTSHRKRVVVPGIRKASLGKDRISLDLVISALTAYPELQKIIEVEVVGGVEDPSVAERLTELEQSACVRNHGKLEWPQMLTLIKESDLLVALRDPTIRRLKYGFPSKVTEALVLGTPVLGNDYSDMRVVLSDSTFGKLIEELSTEEVAVALYEITKERRDRAQVSRLASEWFTPQGMRSSLNDFLDQVK